MFPMGSTIRLLLNEANRKSVANSTPSQLRPVSMDVLKERPDLDGDAVA